MGIKLFFKWLVEDIKDFLEFLKNYRPRYSLRLPGDEYRPLYLVVMIGVGIFRITMQYNLDSAVILTSMWFFVVWLLYMFFKK